MTAVATYGPTSLRCRDVAVVPKKHRNVRMDSRTWFAASRIAELQGQRISDVVRDLLKGYVSKNRRLIEHDAKWLAKLAEIEADEAAGRN